MRRRAPLAALCAMLVAAACVDEQVHDVTGRELFAVHCASCHGAGGAGDGPAAAALAKPPPDLRGIAARSGGAFDEAAVLATIDGRREVAAHGSRSMPVWGAVFAEERRGEPMPVWRSLYDSRVLVDYVRSLQEPPAQP